MLRAKPPVKNDGSEKNTCLTGIISEIKRAAQPTGILRLCSFEFVFLEKNICNLHLLLCVFFIVFMQILLCCGKHKLDPVQLIYFAGTWIVVDGNNVA